MQRASIICAQLDTTITTACPPMNHHPVSRCCNLIVITSMYKDYKGMVSCCSAYLCCAMTPCLLLFGALSHPFIPLHFEEMIFPLVKKCINNTAVDSPIQKIFSDATPKTVFDGMTLINRCNIAALACKQVEVLNQPGTVPNLDQGWQAIVKLELKKYSVSQKGNGRGIKGKVSNGRHSCV